MGCWEGLTRDEVAARYPDQYADWLAGRPIEGRGGEDPAAVGERALAALADLPTVPVVVAVTHGGTAGRLVERLLGLGAEHRRLFGPLANCAWTELALHGSRWRVLRHNTSVLSAPDGAPRLGASGTRASGPGPAPGGASPEEGGPAPAQDADAVA
jgi:probable phosphoglycerate mutase